MALNSHNYTGGRSQPIADLLASGSHAVEAWGNPREGYTPHLVSGDMPTCGCAIGPTYRTVTGLRLDAQRAYGMGHKVIRVWN